MSIYYLLEIFSDTHDCDTNIIINNHAPFSVNRQTTENIGENDLVHFTRTYFRLR